MPAPTAGSRIDVLVVQALGASAVLRKPLEGPEVAGAIRRARGAARAAA